MKELEKRLEEHRTESKICCPPQCFCWDVESFLSKSTEAKPKITAKELAQELSEEEPYLYCDYLVLTKLLLCNFHITRREVDV